MTRDEQKKAWDEILKVKMRLGEISVSEMFRPLAPGEAQTKKQLLKRESELARALNGVKND